MQHHQNPATLDSDPQLPQIKIHHPSSPRHPSCASTPTPGSGRKICVAVDLSDESAYAVRWAVQHYIRPVDAVILLHVSPANVLFGADWGSIELSFNTDPNSDEEVVSNVNNNTTTASDHNKRKPEDDFDAFMASKAVDLAKPLRDAQIPYKIHIVKDHDMKGRLCLEVERLGISAVIMGSRGSDRRLGSVNDYCIHHCVCPVVVVRYPDDKDDVGIGAGGNAGTAVVAVKEGNEGEAVIKPVPVAHEHKKGERHKACVYNEVGLILSGSNSSAVTMCVTQKIIELSSSIEDLNEDLQIEILCRVPYKYLMWCKCVSKHWFFLISNPNPSFVARHRLLSMKKHHPSYTWTYMYFSTKKKKLKAASKDPVFQSQGFSLSFLPCYQPHHNQPIAILGNVNDLFLCCAPTGIGDDPIVYYICNPLTMQWLALPPTTTPGRFHAGIKFICEKEGRFKVIRVISIPPLIFVEIFSSETGGQWMQREVNNKHFTTREIEKIVTCSETLYVAFCSGIMALSLNSLFNNDNSAASDYHVIHHPKNRSSQNQYINILACQERLRVFIVAILNAVPVLYIWDLMEDCSVKGQGHEYEWSRVHCVPFSNMVTFTNKEWFSDIVKTRLPLEEKEHLLYNVLCLQPGDGTVVYLRIHDRVASYDMWSKILTFHSQIKSTLGQRIFEVLIPLQPTPVPKL